MSSPNSEGVVLRAADVCGPSHDMEIYIRDGEGKVRSLVAGRGPPLANLERCQDHFIAHGVCIDCSQAQGATVWAS